MLRGDGAGSSGQPQRASRPPTTPLVHAREPVRQLPLVARRRQPGVSVPTQQRLGARCVAGGLRAREARAARTIVRRVDQRAARRVSGPRQGCARRSGPAARDPEEHAAQALLGRDDAGHQRRHDPHGRTPDPAGQVDLLDQRRRLLRALLSGPEVVAMTLRFPHLSLEAVYPRFSLRYNFPFHAARSV